MNLTPPPPPPYYYYYYAAFNAPYVGHKDDESQARGSGGSTVCGSWRGLGAEVAERGSADGR